ncbi:MAG TPA: hypothetical protein VHC44_06795, partial [Verrucomicrobiae bacterium]|nr:hypothetical protein [Verrucomicrobiae bacterium]
WGINNVEGEIVTLSRQIKQPTPPFESAANGGVEILFRSNLMSSQKSLGRGQILQITNHRILDASALRVIKERGPLSVADLNNLPLDGAQNFPVWIN